MEVKKSPKANLQSKRRTFLLIGLIVALGSMIALFSWSQSEKVIKIAQRSYKIVDFDTVDVIFIEQPKPESVKVKDNWTFSDDILPTYPPENNIADSLIAIWFSEDSLDNIDNCYQFTFAKEKEAVDDNIPVLIAEELPTFQGNHMNTFRSWCAENLVYPAIAAENGVQGRVHLSFVIERDGSISNITVERSSGNRDLNVAAAKVVSESPKWTPGKNRGRTIRFNYQVPIDFVLTN